MSLFSSLSKRTIFIVLSIFVILIYLLSFTYQSHYTLFSTSNTITPLPGLSKSILGRNTWSLLHTIVANYPTVPTENDKSNMLNFFNSLSILYPCPVCSKHFGEYLKLTPLNLENKETMKLWLCNFHNNVNKMLNKEIYDCQNLEKRWPSELCGCDEEAR